MTKANDAKPSRPQRVGPTNRTNPTTGAFRVSDELWEVLAPLIPQQVNTHPLGGGRPRVPDRTCADGICYVLRTGCQWKALDATGICSGSTAHLRFQEWTAAGVFLELWRVGLERFDELPGLDWSWLSRFRRILVRWDKAPENYIAFLHFACALIALRAAGLLG